MAVDHLEAERGEAAQGEGVVGAEGGFGAGGDLFGDGESLFELGGGEVEEEAEAVEEEDMHGGGRGGGGVWEMGMGREGVNFLEGLLVRCGKKVVEQDAGANRGPAERLPG